MVLPKRLACDSHRLGSGGTRLGKFFYEHNSQLGKVHTRLGLIDILLAYKRQFPLLPQPSGIQSSDLTGAKGTEQSEPTSPPAEEQTISQILRKYLSPLSGILHRVEPSSPSQETDGRALWLLPAGWRSGDRFPAYAQAVQNFDWSEFYTDFEGHAYFEWLREQLESAADIVLIDSRTGVTEMSGICTQHMADVVVSLCVPNIQNLDGIFTMVQSFRRPEVLKARGRPLEVMVVPARIDSSEIDDRNAFEKRFKELFDNDQFTPAIFRRFQHKLWDLSIPYVPKYAYSEKLVVGDPKGAAELAKAYNDLAVHLVQLAPEDHMLHKRCNSDVRLVFNRLNPELQKLVERPPRVFISCSYTDTNAFKTELQKRLEQDYPEIIIHSDIQLEGSTDWQMQITNTLASVQAMVVIVTFESLQSQLLHRQWRSARQRGICLYPILAPEQKIDFASLPNWMRKIPLYSYESSRDWQTLIAQLRSPCQAIPVPSMVPDLPSGFVMRPSELERLVLKLQDTRRKRPVTVSLCGPAGSGKTLLAVACCHDERIQETFDDGILWMTSGFSPDNLLGKVEDLIYTLSHKRPAFTSLDASMARLSELLADRNILLVIDDVWNKADLKPFLQSSKQCARLITTRDAEIAATDRASRIQIEGMTVPEALQMLNTQLDLPPDDQRSLDLAERLNLWPLALELAGATLRQRVESGDTYDRALWHLNTALDRRGIIALDQRDAVDRNQAIATAIEESLKQLTPVERERCMQLVTLHEGTAIPLVEVCELWKMSEFDAEEQLEHLHNLSLLKFDVQARTISQYGIIQDYFAASTWGDLYNLPHEYAWRQVANHLVENGRKDEFRRLLLDFNWLQSKLTATEVNALIADYDWLPDDQELQRIQSALRLSAHILTQDKTQLASQLLGRLLSSKASAIQSLLNEANKWRGASWLRPLSASLVVPGGPLIRTYTGHSGEITAVALTPDGQKALTGSADGTLRVWDLVSGRELNTISSPSRVTAVAITIDGRRILSASEDGMLQMQYLTPEAAQTISSYRTEERNIAAAIDPGGKDAFFFSADSILYAWDLVHKSLVHLSDLGGMNIGAAMTPDGRQGSFISADGTLHLWDLTGGVKTQALFSPGGPSNVVAITPDGQRTLFSSTDGTLYLWDSISRGISATLSDPSIKEITAIAISSNGQQALSGSTDGSLKLWNLTAKHGARTSEDHAGSVHTVLVMPDGQKAVSVSVDYTLKVWDVRNGKLLRTLLGHREPITSVAILSSGQYILSASTDGTLRRWDVESGKALAMLEHTGPITAIATTPDSGYVLSVSQDDTLRVGDLKSGALLFTLENRTEPISAIALTPDGQRALYGTEDGYLHIWSVSNRALIHSLSASSGRITAIAALQAGEQALLSIEDGSLQLWDLINGIEVFHWSGHTGPITAIAMTSDGGYILSASQDNTLRFWDLKSGAQVSVLEGHTAQITAITLTLDGQRALSTSRDGSLKVWNLKTGNTITSFYSDSELLTCAVAPDGLTIFAGATSGKVHFLHLEAIS